MAVRRIKSVDNAVSNRGGYTVQFKGKSNQYLFVRYI